MAYMFFPIIIQSQYYNKMRMDDAASPLEILDKFKPRITINSTHRNLYEFPQGNVKVKEWLVGHGAIGLKF